MTAEILIVDDEPDICELVAGILQDEGYTTRTARDADDAIAAIKLRRPNLLFLDIWLQGSKLDGLQILDAAKELYPDLPVVMISGHGNIETAVAAIRRGAYDFIEKPFKADRLVLVADRALENSRLKREVKELKAISPVPAALVGKSPAMNQLRQTIEKVAPTNSRIMIIGTSGSGKELCARSVHNLSGRASGPFVVINAAAITPDLMEVELFGVEQSNGGQARKAGALEEAHGGTLVHRRNRRHAARDAEQDSARAGRPDLPSRRRQREGRRRRAHHFFDRAQSGRRDRSRHISARISITACRSCRSGCRRSRSGARISRCWSNISWTRFPPPPDCRNARSATTRWRCCNRMTGRAMSASSATTSNG